MLKQSLSRNQRSKGFKVKHVLQMFLLLAICVWLLYQMKHSHDNKDTYNEDSPSEVLEKMHSGGEFVKLGRRDLRPLVKDASFGIEQRSGKEEEEVEEGRVGGDDEIDGRDGGAEDLIDEEDRERDEETEDRGIDFEDVNLLEDEAEIEEVKRDIREAREGSYSDDYASSAVVRAIQGVRRRLRKVRVEMAENDNDEVEKESETYYAEHNASLGSENGSNLLIKDEGNEQFKLRNGSMLLLVKDTTTTLNGTELNLASDLSTSSDSGSDGSLPIFSRGISQLDANSGAENRASIATTNENVVSSGESKPNGGVYSGEEGSKVSKTTENSDTVDNEEELVDSWDLSLSEEDEEDSDNSVMDGL